MTHEVHFLYASSLKAYTMDVSPSVGGGSTRRFDVDGILPLPLTRSRCATWFALTRHGGLDVVGSFDSFFILFHALQWLCVIMEDVMLPDSICGVASKELLK